MSGHADAMRYALMMQGKPAVIDVADVYRQLGICGACGQEDKEHLEGKCLFAASSFREMTTADVARLFPGTFSL